MVALYTVTIFVGATLLFLLQPMFARLVLPLLGGSPAVWNTAMVFFQAALLAGYAYAHVSLRRLGARRQPSWHLLLMLLPFAVLPVAVRSGWSPPVDTNPALWLLALMTIAIGLPFFVVSTSSSILQGWFSTSNHPRARDPYFLYAASNAGSMLALLGYPLLVEPNLTLPRQSLLWSWGYGLLVVLTAACAWRLRRQSGIAAGPAMPADLKFQVSDFRSGPAARPDRRKRLRWVVLSFLPSSLLLGVTSHLSTEVAAIPLMWVVPLALYLATFVLVFARRPWIRADLLRRAFPILLVPLVMLFDLHATEPVGGLALLHLAVFFVAALLCHGELAASRPAAENVTEFYLWLAVGGALGGIFNGLVAPLVFRSVAEYPLALALSAAFALQPAGAAGARPWRPVRGDWLWPSLLGAGIAGTILGLERAGLGGGTAAPGIVFGLGAVACFLFSTRPLRFALGIGALLLAGLAFEGQRGGLLHIERSFFGVHRVTVDASGQFHQLLHGKTLHGRQSLDPARRREPLTYYHPTGPVGEILTRLATRPALRVGAVGLGAGSLAGFVQPGQTWTYFEIDPVVAQLARDERYFTYLRDAPAPVRIVLGDARLSLGREPDQGFDLLVLDAYSADSVPVHLATREALALYLRKLAPGGVLAFHISNWHLDLEPVFANLARDAGIPCLVRDDTAVAPELQARGKSPSVWVAMARTPADLALLANDSRWQPARTSAGAPWTDDFSSLLSVFRWW
jgi:SAM-dependent methyltransferase